MNHLKEKLTPASNVESTVPEIKKDKRGRKAGAIFFPRDSLNDALRIPRGIWEQNAGRPFAIGDLAGSLGYSPMSGGFKELIRSASRYGLIEGSWAQDVTKTIALSNLGTSIVAPKIGEDVNAFVRQALETPEVFRGFLNSINGRIIPPAEVCKSTLIRDFHILRDDADVCYAILTQNIQELKLSQETPQGRAYLRMDKLSAIQLQSPTTEQETEVEEVGEEQDTISPPVTPMQIQPEKQIPKQIFVAHGKNHRPLEQLKNILAQFKVPFQVAIDEPHKGRPIGKKVEELMKNCTSGIFIFTADEETTDAKAEKIYRPSDNVVFELGAGIALYGDKIVILREQAVSFGSDFSAFGHITFEKDKLNDKAFELMKELIALGFLQVTPT